MFHLRILSLISLKFKLLCRRQFQENEKRSHILEKNICKKNHLVKDSYAKYTKNFWNSKKIKSNFKNRPKP